jgi:sugar/nucleoside kinase (ribokinase family)
MSNAKRVMGVGSPIVDFLARVPEAFLDSVEGEKGGMELMEPDALDALLESAPSRAEQAPGGSAANTIFSLAHMGMDTAFLGKLGMDSDGDYYQEEYRAVGGDTTHFKVSMVACTARCVSLITPDSERTMRTDLGAAILLVPNEITPADFEGYDFVHVEGYLLFNRDLAEAVLVAAKAAGLQVSLDLGSFEVVQAAQDILPRLLKDYVDIVFANEDEAAAFCGHRDADAALDELGALCSVAAVKLGADGALLKKDGQRVRSAANKVDNVLDTTGAGDCWAAGFLYGHLAGMSLERCGELGALLGGEVVQEIGASPSRGGWTRIRDFVAAV